MIPKVFDGVKVGRLSRPLHNSETMVFEPGLGLLACVFGVIILLEDDIVRGFAKIFEGSLEFIFQDLAVKVSIRQESSLINIEAGITVNSDIVPLNCIVL